MATPTLSLSSLQNLPLAYATCSIGCKPSHTLPEKILAIASAGFTAIELSMPDLVAFANAQLRPQQQGGNPITKSDFDDLCTAAAEVKKLCDAKNLSVVILQPLPNFEGWPAGSAERADAFTRAKGYSRIMKACGTNMLQVGSSDSPKEKIGLDRERFVADLRELADLLAPEGQRIAYENWCWSTHAPEWKDVWDIVKKVDRANFGLCLDTFHGAGVEWADPTTKSGLVEDGRTKEQLDRDWQASCDELARSVPKEKIFCLQISDAYKPQTPLEDREIGGMRPRYRWSSGGRPKPFEGFLPTVEFTKAVLQTGYRGWFSYEVFDDGPDGKGRDYEMADFAKDAMVCQERLMKECADE